MENLTTKNLGICGKADEVERQLRDTVLQVCSEEQMGDIGETGDNGGGGQGGRQKEEKTDADEGEDTVDDRMSEGSEVREMREDFRHLYGPESCARCQQNPFECGCFDVNFESLRGKG